MELRELKISEGTFDYASLFRVKGASGNVSLEQGYNKEDDGILWGMQRATIMKASYSEEERKTRERLRREKPLYDGEIVLIEGKKYKARLKGNYTTAAIFDELTE